MTKKQLYMVIAVLCGVLLYVFFMPVSVTQAPEGIDVDTAATAVEVEEVTEAPGTLEEEKENEADKSEPVVLEGTFVGLLDGENPYGKKFKYMLLHDGVEVLRIDLRPLVGMSDINIIEKLGVDRGDEITVTGRVHDGEFSVKSIE